MFNHVRSCIKEGLKTWFMTPNIFTDVDILRAYLSHLHKTEYSLNSLQIKFLNPENGPPCQTQNSEVKCEVLKAVTVQISVF
jgi:hypothetical protein